jgi:hypothetical protein
MRNWIFTANDAIEFIWKAQLWVFDCAIIGRNWLRKRLKVATDFAEDQGRRHNRFELQARFRSTIKRKKSREREEDLFDRKTN